MPLAADGSTISTPSFVLSTLPSDQSATTDNCVDDNSKSRAENVTLALDQLRTSDNHADDNEIAPTEEADGRAVENIDNESDDYEWDDENFSPSLVPSVADNTHTSAAASEHGDDEGLWHPKILPTNNSPSRFAMTTATSDGESSRQALLSLGTPAASKKKVGVLQPQHDVELSPRFFVHQAPPPTPFPPLPLFFSFLPQRCLSCTRPLTDQDTDGPALCTRCV